VRGACRGECPPARRRPGRRRSGAAGAPLEGSRFATTFQLISCYYGVPPFSGLAIILQAAGVGGVGMGREFAALILLCDARSAARLCPLHSANATQCARAAVLFRVQLKVDVPLPIQKHPLQLIIKRLQWSSGYTAQLSSAP
jgi:hypothetical protein